jgi:two-component system, chemotaxis family, chemotaxis protein CheY
MSKMILVVDDSKAMRLIVRRTLRQAGFGHYEVCEASNGIEALDQIGKQPPALVISDWNMPEMNGIQLLQELNARKVSVRFGFVTTEGTADMRALADQAGALFLIAKPFTPEQFESTLRPILAA